MVLSAEGASAPPQSPERMILQAAAFVQPCPSHVSVARLRRRARVRRVPDVADGVQPIRPPGRES